METESAGLELIHHIRNIQQNKSSPGTAYGQPGQSLEENVIRDYDINDYKTKTELTSLKMRTLLYSSLRSYRDIMALEHSKEGRKNSHRDDSTAKSKFLYDFASAILQQITLFLHLKTKHFLPYLPKTIAI